MMTLNQCKKYAAGLAVLHNEPWCVMKLPTTSAARAVYGSNGEYFACQDSERKAYLQGGATFMEVIVPVKSSKDYATAGNNPLLWAEVNEMRKDVKHLIATYSIASAVIKAERKTSRERAKAVATMVQANVKLIEIGDKLARELVAEVESLEHLHSKWTQHHYRPTLRGKPGSPEMILADVYDHIAKCHGLKVEAFRN